MRAHDERSDHTRPGHRSSTRHSAPDTSAAQTSLLALQRSIGNAAVVAALGRERPAQGVTVQRARPPAGERLKAYGEAMEGGTRSTAKAKRSPALSAFGRPIPANLVDLEEQSTNYAADPDNPQGNVPQAGGRFENLYGQDEEGTLAVMMENYRNPGEEYTASEAFVHQWSRAVAMFNANAFGKTMLKVPTTPEDVPDRLPDSIFRQNISGSAAKETLGELFPVGVDTVTFQENDPTYEKVLATVNGKSTRNMVSTFNEIKALPDDQKFRISGGAITRVQGNFQLRFDVTDRPA